MMRNAIGTAHVTMILILKGSPERLKQGYGERARKTSRRKPLSSPKRLGASKGSELHRLEVSVSVSGEDQSALD
ncbi:hypothetical protein GJ744_010849 [Endocarpon pusillum]|uniref:Uncharacterized protein n=1 Tax=Endocarpon pusillum TaxID=364733 RepID=A0A8H7AFY5_9EURO|nr:hypothetical protein GJ744_010849 [Endocarpon pusillum]